MKQNISEDGQQLLKPISSRKAMKPLLEKKRRARLNACLEELKIILKTDSKYQHKIHDRTEKADILDMTVEYVNRVRTERTTQPPPVIVQTDLKENNSYSIGYGECLHELSHYLNQTQTIDPMIADKILIHLGSRIHPESPKPDRMTPPATPPEVPQFPVLMQNPNIYGEQIVAVKRELVSPLPSFQYLLEKTNSELGLIKMRLGKQMGYLDSGEPWRPW